MIISLIDEAVASGARRWRACETVGLSCRTVERWRAQGLDSDDRRHGPKRNPKNKLSDQERKKVLSIANSPEYRDLSPKQIVPQLADKSTYVASESTFYRILHEEGQMAHRQPSRPATHKPRQYTATGPQQVLSWDITYLRGPVKGLFFYLYMFVDIWSRKILGWAVNETESTDLAAQLLSEICLRIGVDPNGVVLHSDNGR
jgi:transposase InsO family protein